MSMKEIKIPKNMNYQKEEFESKNLDHLGIIAGIIDEIEIVEKINEIFLVDSRLNNSFPDILRGYNITIFAINFN